MLIFYVPTRFPIYIYLHPIIIRMYLFKVDPRFIYIFNLKIRIIVIIFTF
jgi:hypothetical protein